jgi:hypothetical protein
MSNKEVDAFEIPRYGNAKVAFLGTEIGDAKIFLASLFIGLFAGKFIPGMGVKGYLGVPVLGYFLNRAWVDWKVKSSPGYIHAFLYRIGLYSYSSAFSSKNTVFVGDGAIINPDNNAPIHQGNKEQ